jgi:hypothetical protein
MNQTSRFVALGAGLLRNLDLVGLGGLTAALGLAPFVGWGTPGDSVTAGLATGAITAALTLAMRARRPVLADALGLPLVAAGAWALRFAPSVGGFAPYLFLPLVAGYALGPRFGFAAGAVAAAAAGTVGFHFGPWVPYQSLAAGWMGALAGGVGLLMRRRGGVRGRLALGGSAVAGAYLYGVLMNATVWTGLFAGPAGTSWGPAVPLPLGLAHFGAFYVATALAWDTLRGLGLAALGILLPWPWLLRVPWLDRPWRLVRPVPTPRPDALM